MARHIRGYMSGDERIDRGKTITHFLD